uniref:Uncharacterized protein n=1 Tax=Timema monikensis TaxID=170555 RepID=A0A7R9E5M6_9NEOP|nr:unnamed protein product [Timema monikensis]
MVGETGSPVLLGPWRHQHRMFTRECELTLHWLPGCFEWESTARSVVSLVLFIVVCYYFEPYMLPIALLLIFLKHYMVMSLMGTWGTHDEDEEPVGDDDEDDDEKDKEEKKTLKERLQAIQEVTQSVQNSIGYIATLGEAIKNAAPKDSTWLKECRETPLRLSMWIIPCLCSKASDHLSILASATALMNTFNFTVPYLSVLAIIMLASTAVVLYLISVRYLIMAWGVNKFARKLIRPHTVPNNEVLDLLSRVPDDEELLAYRELKSHPTTETERRRDQKKKHKVS